MGIRRFRVAARGVSLAFLLGLGACGTVGKDSGAANGAVGTLAEGFRIGLLLPEKTTARYEKYDRPSITRAVASLCPRCELVYNNANHDHATQRRQIDALLGDGVKVLILDAVDAKAIAPSVAKAKVFGAKVVAYDRLANGPVDAYTSFDNVEIGRMQGRALLDAIRAGGDPRRGPIVMLNGSPEDPSAAELKKGAHSVLDGRVTIAREYDIPGWNAAKAADEAVSAFAALGPGKVIGIYSADDGMAGGVAAAMERSGVRPGTPLTGQDAELAAIRRILLGTQTMTVYKPIGSEARSAARFAVDIACGKTVYGTTTVANGTTVSIPARLIPPVLVTSATIAGTVVEDSLITAADLVHPSGRSPGRPAGAYGRRSPASRRAP
ncbi:substrate-binding domain-containing protein [Planotetraspora sp. GP83]|uniref:substrate-binding domain-containing protein n=1 Tax=Planotetraspora sp. GP83 TaxID=3156264 RepID=UPI003518D608